jgi:hypothetical protein
MQDAKRYDIYNAINGNKRSFRDKDRFENHIPPYIRKYNRRFKLLYKSMHSEGNDMSENDRKNPRKKKKNVYGHYEKYQSHGGNNDIPQSDILSELLQKSRYRKSKQHHQYHHHKQIKKLRSKPEAGIMQKKLKQQRN